MAEVGSGRWRRNWTNLALCFLLPWFAAKRGSAAEQPNVPTEPLDGLTYTNLRVTQVPWSIHIATLARTNRHYALESVHAGAGALGLSTVSQQARLARQGAGATVAAINGDFYQRDKVYAGDPRGIQVSEGQLLSAPNGGISFWVDALGEPHATNIAAHFQVTLPGGLAAPFGLNENRQTNALVLYTPAIGRSTRTVGGRELILEKAGAGKWLPLRLGATYTARVREVRDAGDTPLAPDILVLSVAPATVGHIPQVETGALLQISTETLPALHGVRTAIGGGPMLVRNGRALKIQPVNTDSYEFSSMLERHPRAAVGWNESSFFMVEVDGRQKELSVGMTLEELASLLVKLGCREAMNLDGGGSATLWYNGQVRNSPCDGFERPTANSLLVVRRDLK